MHIRDLFGQLEVSVKNYETVSGGDINKSFKLHCSEGKFFLKVNEEERFPKMFEREAEALTELKNESSFVVPKVICAGKANGLQFLLMEWQERKPDGDWEDAGRRLAELHRKQKDIFGFNHDNYIGSLEQKNEERNNWPEFFAECRIFPLLTKLENRLSIEDLKNATSFLKKISSYFPEESACTLHGDLWNGNFMFTESGPCIYDPAIYYGHRYMDLGMTKLFGGFPESFYNSYNEVYPLDRKWKQYIETAQLYPLLVHAVLFGGSYINSVKCILRKFS